MIQLLSFFVILGFKCVLFVFATFAVATYAPGFMLDLKQVVPNAIDASLHYGPIVMGEIEAQTFALVEKIEAQAQLNYAHAEEFAESEIGPDNRF